VRGIRGVRIAKDASSKTGKTSIKAEKEEDTQEEKPQRKIGESLFGVTNGSRHTAAPTNPFSNPFSSSSAANPFAASKPKTPAPTKDHPDEAVTTLPDTFASKVRLSASPPSVTQQSPRPHEPWPETSSFPPPYPHYQLDADYETLDVPSVPQIPTNAPMDLDTEGSGSGGGKEDTEVFESSLDKMFQKFADRLGQNPEQVLRYEFRGKPLLYSNADPVGKLLASHSEKGSSSNMKITTTSSRGGAGMPRCQNCGAERVFELQLTPHAIIELEADEMSIDGMEWGTIIMGVCSNDCKPNDVLEGEVGYLEEWIGVQWEEVASKR
jgi:pre-rRNA-processing protein TSR4